MVREAISFSASLFVFSEKLVSSRFSEESSIPNRSFLEASYLRTFSKDRNF